VADRIGDYLDVGPGVRQDRHERVPQLAQRPVTPDARGLAPVLERLQHRRPVTGLSEAAGEDQAVIGPPGARGQTAGGLHRAQRPQHGGRHL